MIPVFPVTLAFLGFLIGLLYVIFIIASLLMVLVIMMQRPKEQGLGAAFGGEMAQSFLGAGASNVLVKITVWLGGIFLGCAILISLLQAAKRSQDERSALDGAADEQAEVQEAKPGEQDEAAAEEEEEPEAEDSGEAQPEEDETEAAEGETDGEADSEAEAAEGDTVDTDGASMGAAEESTGEAEQPEVDKAQAEPELKETRSFENEEIRSALEKLATQAGVTLKIDGELSGREPITANFLESTPMAAMQAIASLRGLELTVNDGEKSVTVTVPETEAAEAGDGEAAAAGGDAFVEEVEGFSDIDELLQEDEKLEEDTAPLLLGGDILFEKNSAGLDPAARPTLEKLALLLLQQPDISYRIEGHTDTTGQADYNQRLSEERAESVARILREEFQIPAERIETVGHGESRPLVEAGTREEHGQNRRVEITIQTSGEG